MTPILLALLWLAPFAAAQDVDAEFHLHKHVILRDPAMIGTFLDEFSFYPDVENIDRSTIEYIEFVDTMDDGYSAKDIFAIQPQGVQVVVDHLSPSLKTQMESWSDPAPLSAHSFPRTEAGFQQLEQLADGDDYCLKLRVLSALQKSYDGEKIGMHVTLDEDGYAFRLWNVNEANLIPPEGGCLDDMGGSGRRVDLLVAQSTDTVWVPDTVMIDLLYIVQTQTDSIFTGKGSARSLLFEESE